MNVCVVCVCSVCVLAVLYSPGVAEDALHASVVGVPVLHVVPAPPGRSQLLLIVCEPKQGVNAERRVLPGLGNLLYTTVR